MVLDELNDYEEQIIGDSKVLDSMPSLEGRNGRPILMSFYACWQKDFQEGTKEMVPEIMGGLLMIIVAMLVEALRYLRESFESSAHLVISRHRIDVNTKKVTPALDKCADKDEDCLRVVDEVVIPLELNRCHWRHFLNSLLYGCQCGLQLQCLLGVLSLNVPLIVAVLVGVYFGRLFFNWRPRRKLLTHRPR